MSLVRRRAAAGLDQAVRCWRRQRMAAVAAGISTVHLSYAQEKAGHALTGARQPVPEEQANDPVTSPGTGLPLDLRFRAQGAAGRRHPRRRIRRGAGVRLHLR